MKILIADDDPDILEALTKLLGGLGHVVETFDDGIHVMSRLEEAGDFDLVITDLMMPKMWGTTVLKNIRTSERFKELPVIVHSLRDVRDEVTKLGGVYVEKKVPGAMEEAVTKIWFHHDHAY